MAVIGVIGGVLGEFDIAFSFYYFLYFALLYVHMSIKIQLIYQAQAANFGER